jgi:beta-barrel assembly-enhancing protease
MQQIQKRTMIGTTLHPGACRACTDVMLSLKCLPSRLRRSAWPLSVVSAVAMSLALPPAPLQAQVQLPTLGDAVSADLSLGDERRYGDLIMTEIRPDPAVLDDPLLSAYITSLWLPLIKAARTQGDLGEELWDRFAWETFLVRDRSVNAFALPGGFVGVHLGLIAITQGPDELASVMAHEMAHVTQRHIARRLVGDAKSNTLALIGTLLGVLAASRAGDIQAANAVIMGGQAAALQSQLNFSRDMEREADRVGFTLMAEAGFRPTGMVRMFERMEQAMHLTDSGSFPYLRSHPLTSERIGEARQRVSLYTPVGVDLDRTEHALMAARSRVLMDERAENLAVLEALDSGGREAGRMEQLAYRYTAALAAYKLNHRARGDAAVLAAQRYLPEAGPARVLAQRLFTLLQAEGAQMAGDGAAGLALLNTLSTQPVDRAVMLLRANLAAQANSPASARASALEWLQTRVVNEPRDATAWALAGRLWELDGQQLRAVRAQAESRAALGDAKGAIERLRAAMRLSRSQSAADPIEAQVIDARLRALTYARRAHLQALYPRGVPRGIDPDEL